MVQSNHKQQNPSISKSQPISETKFIEQLPFKVFLSDQEKQQKEQVILPYTHHLNQQNQKELAEFEFDDEDDDLDI
jgi:hypothetical protein